jgi:hypothetical protein
MNNLIGKYVSFFTILFLLIGMILPSIYAFDNSYDFKTEDFKNEDFENILGYQIDQYQDNVGGFNMIIGNFKIAQSFKPSLSPLVKIDLFGYSIDDGKSLEVSIRKNVFGEDLAFISIHSADIPRQISWFECDFSDIDVEINETYYIIVNQIGDGKFNWFGNQNNDFYPEGFCYSNDENTQDWVNLSQIFTNLDFCFKTYSYGDNLPPDSPVINGSSTGKSGEEYNYEFYSIDPEDNDVLFRIDWGDNSSTQWFGTFNSEELVSYSHVWGENGDYVLRIQSKDIYGDKSEWSLFEIAIAKNRFLIKNSYLFKLFENHRFYSSFIDLF